MSTFLVLSLLALAIVGIWSALCARQDYLDAPAQPKDPDLARLMVAMERDMIASENQTGPDAPSDRSAQDQSRDEPRDVALSRIASTALKP